MHEWALAEGVVVAARELSERQGLRKVTRIVLRVGELQRISPEFFRTALSAVMPPDDAMLGSAELELNPEPAGFTCRRCERSFTLADAGGELDDLG